MSNFVTVMLGARVEVSPDPEITSEGVDQKVMLGRVVAVFMYPTHHPAFSIPVYQVVLDDKTMVDIVMASRMKVLSVPALLSKITIEGTQPGA